MNKYFVDTNVLIDFLTFRESYKQAAEILNDAKKGKYKVCTSALSMANLVYILRKVLKGEVLYDTLNKLSFIEITPIGREEYLRAVSLKSNDFEDALQYFSALSYGCNALITRNIKDFPFANIPTVSPVDFVKGLY